MACFRGWQTPVSTRDKDFCSCSVYMEINNSHHKGINYIACEMVTSAVAKRESRAGKEIGRGRGKGEALILKFKALGTTV